MRDEVGVAVERGAGGQTIGVCPTIVSCPQVERDHVARRETIRGVTSGLTPRIPYEPPSTVTRHPRNLKETDRLVTLVKPRGNSNDGYRMLTGTRGTYRESPTHNTLSPSCNDGGHTHVHMTIGHYLTLAW